jgi:hypothetical protein
LENLNKVVIGNLAGTVYFIPTDFDPNAPPDELNDNLRKWTFYRSGAAFVSTPAYSPDTGLVYIGAAEGAAQFGRLFAFKPTVLDDPNTPEEDERIAWVYPRDDAPQKEVLAVNAVTSTPAVSGQRVYFTTSTLNRGRIFAVNARTGALEWRYPPAPTDPNARDDQYLPLTPYSSPLIVPNLRYGTTLVREALYVCGADGRVYGFNATEGIPLEEDPNNPLDDYVSERLGGAIFSSPVFTYVSDTNDNGNVVDIYPAVVVATDSGLLLALHADHLTNARGGKAFEGWDLYGNAAFASPAVLDGWLYAADNDGVAYAYHFTGVANAGEAGERIEIRRRPPQAKSLTAPTTPNSRSWRCCTRKTSTIFSAVNATLKNSSELTASSRRRWNGVKCSMSSRGTSNAHRGTPQR